MTKAEKYAGIFLLLMGVAGVLFIIYISQQETTGVRVYFDNGLDVPVTIEADGKAIASMAAHAGFREDVSLEVGKHKIRVLGEKGEVIEEKEVDFPKAQGITDRYWAYNVAQKNEYLVRSVGFGNAKPEDPQPIGKGQVIFELPSPWFLPSETAPTKGKAGTTTKCVGHVPVHAAAPCCANLRLLFEPPAK